MIITEESIREACNFLAETLIAKNKDYGNSVEEQFKEYGDASINLRIEDKLRRLKNLAKQKAHVTSEKKSETVLDAAGYSLLAFILYNRLSLDEPTTEVTREPIEGEPVNGWRTFSPGKTITTVEHLPVLDMNYTEQDSMLGAAFAIKYSDQDDQY